MSDPAKGQDSARADIEPGEALGFILDAMRQVASFTSVPISQHEWFLLSESMSVAEQDSETSRLIPMGIRLLHTALMVDAKDEATVIIDADVLLPKSWVESYEVFADEEDPPLAFVLLERAGQILT